MKKGRGGLRRGLPGPPKDHVEEAFLRNRALGTKKGSAQKQQTIFHQAPARLRGKVNLKGL